MAKILDPQQAVHLAQQALDDRIEAIRVLAQTRQNLAIKEQEAQQKIAELKAQLATEIKQAQRDNVLAYNKALSSGWTIGELRKIGYTQPPQKRRSPRKSTVTKPVDQPVTTDSNNEPTPQNPAL